MSTIINNPDANHNAATSRVDYTNGTRNKNLKFVDNLADYQVHHDDVDIRGFDVRLASGEKIGDVEGLLADVPSKLVRYVEIEVEDDVIERHTLGRYHEDDKHVLVPVGLIKINTDKTVTIYGLELNNMIDYPRYNRANGYTTNYELDTAEYLNGFHEYRDDKFGGFISEGRTKQRDTFDDTFYSSKFYTGKFSR